MTHIENSAMPTAVMTESREKTMSRIMIWAMAAAKEGGALVTVHLALGIVLELVVDLPGGRLVDEEDAARDEDEVLRSRSPMPNQTTTSSFSVMIQPGEEHQDHADHHREREAEVAGARLLLLRELRREDRDEDDVVDAEHDLEHEQRHEDGDEVGREGEGEVHPPMLDGEGRRLSARADP